MSNENDEEALNIWLGAEHNIKITERGATLLLKLMKDDNPEFNYKELAELSIIMSQLKKIVRVD